MQKLLAIGAAGVLYILSVMASVRVSALPTPAVVPMMSAASSESATGPSTTSRLSPGSTSTSTSISTSQPASVAFSDTEGSQAAGTGTEPEFQGKSESAWYLPGIPLSRELQAFTYELCQKLDVPYTLVLGVMEVESHFRTDALREGETADMVGIMQINSRYLPSHYQKYGVEDAYDPKDNITIGVNMLAESIRRNGVTYALMEYNMGIVNMRKKRDSGVVSTSYTRKVLEARKKYEEQLEELYA